MKILEKQVLMFYHLKTRHCVNTVHIRMKHCKLIPQLKSLLAFFIKSHEKGLITKGRIITHKYFKIVFKQTLHISKLVIAHFYSGKRSLQAAINTSTLQVSLFKCFATCMTHLLLSLKCSILEIMYSTYNTFCGHING